MQRPKSNGAPVAMDTASTEIFVSKYQPSGHIWTWELDCEESWVPKNWCFWTVVLEKTLENPLDCKEIQPVHSKGDQAWVFIGRTDAEAQTPILWPPHAKSWLIGKDPDAGRYWGQEEKGTTEDEMAGWHHQLNGREFEWTPGVGDGQGGLACCSSWGRKESDTTEQLNWTELNWKESELLLKVDDSRTGSEKEQNEPGACCAKNKEMLKGDLCQRAKEQSWKRSHSPNTGIFDQNMCFIICHQ